MAFDAARIFAERLRSNIERRPWGKEAPGLKVTVSFGVACGPLADWQTVLVSADIALYAAKRRGRNAVEGAQSHTPIAIGPKTTNKL
jgi:GGDEF domain-containing protein